MEHEYGICRKFTLISKPILNCRLNNFESWDYVFLKYQQKMHAFSTEDFLNQLKA